MTSTLVVYEIMFIGLLIGSTGSPYASTNLTKAIYLIFSFSDIIPRDNRANNHPLDRIPQPEFVVAQENFRNSSSWSNLNLRTVHLFIFPKSLCYNLRSGIPEL
ncbi:hypothetical protein PoB_007496100 [Plakobranchus ocellatus]|uniref:Uncharacterized protein n=1 Tax=Plakobranchus ocellatus TaxID=259542 RepID=A0AAV4DWG9_9GAST|nr:hypothetical protein PoB_007496100 [Plakobranchus ocellatus]